MEYIKPVSYTHLDVYKRQPLDEQAAEDCRKVLSAFFEEMTEWEQYMEPVSYTHLDVYKRQTEARWISDR